MIERLHSVIGSAAMWPVLSSMYLVAVRMIPVNIGNSKPYIQIPTPEPHAPRRPPQELQSSLVQEPTQQERAAELPEEKRDNMGIM